MHVPFCARRCGYCDFTLVAGRLDLVEDYLRAVELEASVQAPPAEVDTLYFGGGTPSQLPGEAFDRLCRTAQAWRPLAAGGEWTVEANPADVTAGWIDRLAGHGVTRLSLGGQSFDDDKLRLLERDHTAGHIRQSIAWAQSAGLEVCLDLIFAAPSEGLEAWRRDLDHAIALRPGHISTYGLTIEQGTSFWGRRLRGSLVEVDDGLQREMYLLAIDTLTAAGYQHYEVSSFAKPGRRSRHNLAYWRGDGCYALGPGATRYVDGVRETNHRSTLAYLRRVLAGGSAVAEREELTAEQRAREALVFGLRQIDGVCAAEFRSRTGYTMASLVGDAIERFTRQGLLETVSGRLRLTREGLLLSDALWPDLL
ncbi:MAG: radical SAM family heme chaperone HemW [Planctomycetota bacterium]